MAILTSMYVKTNQQRSPEFNRQPTEPKPQIAERSPANYQKYAKELSSFQTSWVEVKFRKKPIIVSRGTFSEVVKWRIIEIIYTTANGKEDEEEVIEKVIVSFNQTAKIYEILYPPSPNSTTNSSLIKIDPATKEGKAWIRCLQGAYPYYDFENAEISPNYQKLAKTLTDQWMLEQLQQTEVSVPFEEGEISASRRTFWEVAKRGIIEIIYTTANDKEDEEKVIVSFNPITKTYQILTTRTNLSTEIEPSTEVGKAWIQCLQEAYPYYDFENAEISPNYQELAKTLIDEWMLEQLQQIEISVPFEEEEILVSRRTFSEVVRSQAPTIIYDDFKRKQIVFVGFNPTTKTYQILTTRTNLSTEIEPSTEEGKAWIQCLHLAYSYYNFQQAKIKTEYEHLVGLLKDPSELIGTEQQPDRHLQNPDSEDLLLLLPKVVHRQEDKILSFDSNSNILLKYLRIGLTVLENPEELANHYPGLSWFDSYTHTYYTLLFHPDSKEYVLTYRYRKECSLYIITLHIQVIDANTGHVSLVKKIIKQTKAPKPRDPTENQTPTSEDNDQAQQTEQNQVATIAPDILDSLTENINSVLNLTKTEGRSQFVQAVIAQMVETLPSTDILKNHSNQEYIEKFFQKNKIPILNRLFPRDSTPEETAGLQSEGKHPELVTLINLFHSAFPDYDFSLGKVKDKK